MLRQTLDDARYALRTLSSRLGFTTLVVLTLAVGIGATTAMFAAVDAALLGQLPFEEPERLVMGRATFGGDINPWVSGYDYYDYREQSRSFESLAAFMFGGPVTVLGGAEPERVESAFATWDLFQTLRVKPVAGRSFTTEEGVEGAPAVVMISYGFWQRRFGGAPEAVGRPLLVRGTPHTIVGVLPAGFHFLTNADIWRLTYYNGPGAEARRWHNLLLVGRLKAGVSLQRAQAEVDTISARLQQQYPETNESKALAVTELHDALVEDVRPKLLMLMAAVSLILLLACGNVASLLLARGQGRLSEIAIRATLGASRFRVMGQLLAEALAMAVIAGGAGIALSLAFKGLLVRLLPLDQLGITRLGLDPVVLLFALGVSVATGLVFGVVPALQGTLIDVSQQLRAGARATYSRRGACLRHALVVLQVAISTVLLIGAGLMIRSLGRQMNVDLGFDPSNVLTASIELPEGDYPEPQARMAFIDSLSREVEALPGVLSVGLVNRLPIRQGGGNIYLHRVDQPPEEGQSEMSRSADFRCVTPGYLRTMGIRLLAGRDIALTDAENAPRVMVVSESLAELFFPGQNPLGQRLVVDMGDKVVHEIVGVVGNARLSRITRDPFHAMYMSYYQVPRRGMRLAVRTASDPTALTGAIRQILRRKDPRIPLAEPASMRSIVDDSMSDFRVITASLGFASAVALALALLGLYGVLAYYVSQRYHEIGVRMALGASLREVAHLILSRGLTLVMVGLVVGLVAAFAASRLLRQLLFGVGPADPATYVVAAIGFGAAGFFACLLPALRATRIDPVVILKKE